MCLTFTNLYLGPNVPHFTNVPHPHKCIFVPKLPQIPYLPYLPQLPQLPPITPIYPIYLDYPNYPILKVPASTEQPTPFPYEEFH